MAGSRHPHVSYGQPELVAHCYASLPLVFDWIKEHYVVATTSKELVVSPLTLLKNDQVEKQGH